MAKKESAREKHLIKLLEQSRKENNKLKQQVTEAKKDAFRYHNELMAMKYKPVSINDLNHEAKEVKRTSHYSTSPYNNIIDEVASLSRLFGFGAISSEVVNKIVNDDE